VAFGQSRNKSQRLSNNPNACTELASVRLEPRPIKTKNGAGLCPVPANWWPPAKVGTKARGYPIIRTPVPNLLRWGWSLARLGLRPGRQNNR